MKKKYDLHIHTKYSSDGVLEPARIVNTAIKLGLSGIAVIDHNTIRGGLEARQFESENFKIIVGSEIQTDRGEITGLFLTQEVEPGDATSVISDIKSQGGIIIIPHPFDEMRHSALHPTEEDVQYIDAIEIFNSRCVFQKYNRRALDFAREHSLPVVAGSDAHYSNEIGSSGIITTDDDIRKAIIENNVEIFGKRTSILNHARTKVLKTWRKAVKSG